MTKPLISIIIPVYNRAHLIGETLESILVQTYSNWECIVIDDGSVDNTEGIVGEYVKKDNRFQFHKRPDNRVKGANACRNYGFELSKGEWIKWFDSDDVLLKNAISTNSSYFNSEFDVVISSLEYVDYRGIKMDKKHNFISKNTIEDYLIGKITFFTFTPTWRRMFLIQQLSLFDENIFNLDDWDFNLRMLYEDPSIAYIEEPLIQYRIHTDSLSHEIGKLNFKEIRSEMRARAKHVNLIKQNKRADITVLKKFIIGRYKYFFKEAMVQKNDYRLYYLKKVLQKELQILDFKGIFKTLFGSVVFLVFNKGYKLLK